MRTSGYYYLSKANPCTFSSANRTRRGLRRAAKPLTIPGNPDAYRMGILGLPNELLLLIAENLAVLDLLSFRSASQCLSSLLTPRFYDAILDASPIDALKWAATYDHALLAELAIARDARVYIRDLSGLRGTPLHLATMHNSPNVICTLIKHGAPAAKVDRYWSLIHLAAMNNCPDSIRILVKHGAPTDKVDGYRTPLHVAASWRSQRAVRVLLELGASMKLKDARWEAPPRISAHLGDVDSMRAFVDAGLDFHLKDYQGRTILYNGICGGKEMVEFLLEWGGEKVVNDQDNALRTPLHSAVTKDDAEIIKLLVRHGADTEVKDNKGHTPMDLAITMGKDSAAGALLGCRGNISGR